MEIKVERRAFPLTSNVSAEIAVFPVSLDTPLREAVLLSEEAESRQDSAVDKSKAEATTDTELNNNRGQQNEPDPTKIILRVIRVEAFACGVLGAVGIGIGLPALSGGNSFAVIPVVIGAYLVVQGYKMLRSTFYNEPTQDENKPSNL